MARENTNQTIPLTAPDYLAWHVTQKGEKSFWNKVSAAWKHKDGCGDTLQINAAAIFWIAALAYALGLLADALVFTALALFDPLKGSGPLFAVTRHHFLLLVFDGVVERIDRRPGKRQRDGPGTHDAG